MADGSAATSTSDGTLAGISKKVVDTVLYHELCGLPLSRLVQPSLPILNAISLSTIAIFHKPCDICERCGTESCCDVCPQCKSEVGGTGSQ